MKLKKQTRTLNNRLFASFVEPDDLDETLELIQSRYNILYNKIFILKVLSSDEFICTYSVDMGNVDSLIEDTILVHRKKDTNTLYTINALNEIIKRKNGGYLDRNYTLNWDEYQSSILLTQNDKLKILKTKIHTIIEM